MNNLTEYLKESAKKNPQKIAVVDPNGTQLTYAELDEKSNALAHYLESKGVKKGDRVGIVLPKSTTTVITLFGIMKAGAAYVPVDFTAPIERGNKILTDCDIRALVVDTRSISIAPDESHKNLVSIIVVGEAGTHADSRISPFTEAVSGVHRPSAYAGTGDLAYILYTSGSTGIPKGVMLTHENALGFVEWCSSAFKPTSNDRFSSHAPFHFDLSVFDIYLCIKHGATLYLISEDLGKNPKELAKFISVNKLTFWYSTPSILTLLLQYGNLPSYDVSSLRLVFFAGEVFPIKHLREIKKQWPHPIFYNLYGPTETNVCTYAQIPEKIPDDRVSPYPIGFLCTHCEGVVIGADGSEVPVGEEGLLYISGSSVFSGYWNRPKENSAAFMNHQGKRWYNTGDVVRWKADEGYIYIGRKDRMVKRRGFRVELGEIEKALYSHPEVREAAVISVPDNDAGVKIVAFLSYREGFKPSIVEVKTFSASKIPAYMIPDQFIFQESLPKTSTDKIDYQGLRRQIG